MTDPIIKLLEEAGRLAMASWRVPGVQVTDKSGGRHAPDLVSDADLEVNEFVTAGLSRLHGDVTLVSEEAEPMGSEPPADAFILDPIDGTHNYLGGSALWTIALARTRGHEVEEAWVHHPPTGETSHAKRGSPTTHDGVRVRVSLAPARRGLVSISLTRDLMPLLIHSGQFAGVRALGSHAFCLAATARGEFLLHAGGGKPWDIAAGFLLIENAGGRVCDLEGNPRSPFDLNAQGLAGSPSAVQTALELMRS